MESFEVFSLFLSMFLTLGFVLFLAWFFLSWMNRRLPTGSVAKHIKVLDKVIIDREKYLLLVSAGERTMLIAMSSGAVETVCEFSLEEASQFTEQPLSGQSFSTVIKQFMPQKRTLHDENGGGSVD